MTDSLNPKTYVFNEYIQKTLKKIGGESARKVLERRVFNPDDVNTMINAICDEIVTTARKMNPNFKYIAHCVIIQK